jgi:hypothetical protein
MTSPIICFGQQPCGFFPKNFLVAKIDTARKMQKELGGKIVFFYHDSDADYRETISLMIDRVTGAEVRLNFLQENKIQKKYSPLYAKKIPSGWKEEILKQLPRFADKPVIELFNSTEATNAADFCLEMYKKMRLLDDIEIFRSGDKNFREQATDLVTDYFADVEYEGEIVRAQAGSQLTAESRQPVLQLHEGGGKHFTIPTPETITKAQKNPGRDQRFAWMQSIIHCTHYIFGEGEKAYLKLEDFPDVKFIDREKIENSDRAWLPS